MYVHVAYPRIFGIHLIARAGDYFQLHQACQTLMDCRARHTAFKSHILGGDACVVHNYFENLSVEFVDSVEYIFHIIDWFFNIQAQSLLQQCFVVVQN